MTLRAENITVQFGGFVALDSVSVSIEPGMITSVIGPNGSGKSTLFNSITGLVPLKGGRVTLDERDISRLPPHMRMRQGMSRTFQTPRIDPEMSVETSVLCGLYPNYQGNFLSALMGTISARRVERRMKAQAREALARLGLLQLAEARMGELPIGQVRMVDVARAVVARPRYLLLDEPAAGLSHEELAVLAGQIKAVAGSGTGVLLVEHNFHLVKELAEKVMVLNLGRKLLDGTPEKIARDPEFVQVYLGTSGVANE